MKTDFLPVQVIPWDTRDGLGMVKHTTPDHLVLRQQTGTIQWTT